MSRYRFELAGPADEADLRRVLAATPMAGRVGVSFRREPDYFAGSAVDGRFRQVIACRDEETGRVVGFGTRSVMRRHVNGEPRDVGYLSGLRLLAEHRSRGLLARGFAALRREHADGRAPLYLTTIVEDNAAALSVLLGGRAGLPTYHPAGRCPIVALTRRRGTPGLQVRRAPGAGELLAYLRREGPRRQFFPVYEEGDFFAAGGIFKGLTPEDVWLAYRGGEVVGALGSWDQSAYKQTVVEGYAPALRLLRPAYNAWARLTGAAALPAPGEALRYRTAAFPLADDAEALAALLAAARAALPRGEVLMLGMHEADPLAKALGRPAYTTGLYLACWPDGDALRASLDGRPPYVELGCL